MEDQLEKEIREEFDGVPPKTKKKNKIGNLFKSQEIKELTSGDEEVFEIVDYTLASPWEKFISQVENVFRGWNLHGEGYASGVKPTSTSPLIHSHVVREQFNYGGKPYQLIYHYHQTYNHTPETEEGKGGEKEEKEKEEKEKEPENNEPTEEKEKLSEEEEKRVRRKRALTDLRDTIELMMDPTLDFPPSAHHLQRWFGFKDFLILAPMTEQGPSESEANLLLSTLSIVINDCKCPVPVFVPIGERWRGVYAGYMRQGGLQMHVTSKLTQAIPAYLSPNALQGLVSLYYRQLGLKNYDNIDEGNPLSDYILSVRYTHMRGLWSGRKWRSASKELGLKISEQNVYNINGFWEKELIWGTNCDPIDAIHLARTWIGIPVTANRMDPEHFPWKLNPALSLRCLYKTKTLSFLAEAMKTLFAAQRQAKFFSSMEELRLSAGSAAIEAMGNISRSLATLRSTFPSGEEIDAIIRDVFDQKKEWNPNVAEKYWSLSDRFLKAAPPGSLLSSLVISFINLEGLYGIGILWSEFVRELRWHWENLILIPRVTHSRIQYNSCLIYQKLQMLNHCIHREIELRDLAEADNKNKEPKEQEKEENQTSEGKEEEPTTSAQFKYDGEDDITSTNDNGGWDDFEISDDEMESDKEVAPKEEGDKEKPANDNMSARKGASHRHAKLFLLNGEEMWIPRTQDVGHMTEDMLREKELFFADLGSSTEAAQIRANMQSASLLSDMQAFKAANPDCELEDFVRWYSPSDWIEEPRPKYEAKLQALKEAQLEEIKREKAALEQEKKEKAEALLREQKEKEEKEKQEAERGTMDSLILQLSPRGRRKETPKEEETQTTTANAQESEEKQKQDKEGETTSEEKEEKKDAVDSSSDENKTGDNNDGQGNTSDSSHEAIMVELEENWDEVYRCFPLKDDIVGHLSPRMQMPGNIWRQKWKEAKSLPVSEQELLFDHAAEAEKVLHQLDSMSPSVFMEQVITVCFNSIYFSLVCLPCTKIEVIKSQIENLHKVFASTNPVDLEEEEAEVVGSSIAQVEVLLSRATSLLFKFPGQYDMVTELLGDRGEIPLSTLAERNSAEALFADHCEPEAREYIFRSKVPRPYVDSKPTGQRMYALLTHQEFRLAAAFSSSDEFI